MGKESGRRMFDPWVGKIPWRRKWQPTPVFLSGEAHGQRILEGYSPMGHKAHTHIKSLGISDEEKDRICPWAVCVKRGVFNLLHPGYKSHRLSRSDCSPRFVLLRTYAGTGGPCLSRPLGLRRRGWQAGRAGSHGRSCS